MRLPLKPSAPFRLQRRPAICPKLFLAFSSKEENKCRCCDLTGLQILTMDSIIFFISYKKVLPLNFSATEEHFFFFTTACSFSQCVCFCLSAFSIMFGAFFFCFASVLLETNESFIHVSLVLSFDWFPRGAAAVQSRRKLKHKSALSVSQSRTESRN